MTARPSGAFCSPASPSPSAIGIMPMIIASAVMITGRRRVRPASSAASSGDSFSFSMRMSLAKLTSRIEFETAMPTDMIDPISDSTLIVVCVNASIQRMPTMAPGTATMMMNGSSHDWNRITIRQ